MPTHSPTKKPLQDVNDCNETDVDGCIHVIPRTSLQELLSKAAPGEQVDDAVEDFLLDLADDFVDTVTSFACKMASHRRSESVQVKDIKAGPKNVLLHPFLSQNEFCEPHV
jgi:transcription initiation factor TFIID subunit 12